MRAEVNLKTSQFLKIITLISLQLFLTGCLCYEVTNYKAASWLPNGKLVYVKKTNDLIGSGIKGKNLNHQSNIVEYDYEKDQENVLFAGDASKILSSPNGKYLAMGREIYSYKGKLIRRIPIVNGMDNLQIVSWSPDSGKVLYITNRLNQEEYQRSQIGIYNTQNRYNKIYTRGENPIFIANNKFLYVDSKRDIDYAYLYNSSTRKSVKTGLMIDLLQNCKLISPSLLVSLSDNRLHRISTKSLKAYKTVSCVMVEKDNQIDIDFRGKRIISKDNKKDFYHLTTVKDQSSTIILIDDKYKINDVSKVVSLYKQLFRKYFIKSKPEKKQKDKPKTSFLTRIKKLIPKK